MDEAVLRQQAAETLRSVEGMRRRTITAGGRASTFALLMFGITALVGAAFGLLDTPRCFYQGLGPGITQGSCGSRSIDLAAAIGIFAALVVALVATEIHYRRQQVHPAQPKRHISTAQAILIAAVAIVFGPVILGALFLIVTAPFISAAGSVFFLLYSVAAVVQGRRMNNGALAWAGAFAAVWLAAARFINTDYQTAIAGAFYGATFLGAAGLVRIRRSQAA